MDEFPRLAIAAIFRNECPYVIEWLAHHRVVGFHSFYIADNESDDGTTELLLALQSLGYLTRIHFPNPPGQPPQFAAYERLLRQEASSEQWVALVDADEFIVPMGEHRSIRSALRASLAQENVGAIALNWACYGSSWHYNRTLGGVLDRFTRRSPQSFGPNMHYKSLLRLAAFSKVQGNPHHFELRPGFRYVQSTGQDLQVNARHGKGLSQQVVWENVRVNHYLVKSREEFDTNKRPKGRVSMVGGTKGEKYYQGHNRNDVADPAPAWLLPRVLEEQAKIEAALASFGFSRSTLSNVTPIYERPFEGIRAHLDRVEWIDGRIHLKGWAMHGTGLPPVCLAVEVGQQRHLLMSYEHTKRSDLARVFPMACEYLGFEFSLPLAEAPVSTSEVKLFAGLGPDTPFGPFVLGAPIPPMGGLPPEPFVYSND